MPITKSAKKAQRSSLRKKANNDIRKRELKASIKAFHALIAEKNYKEAAETLARVFKAVDKAAKTGVIKKGNADRKKSRLARSIVSK